MLVVTLILRFVQLLALLGLIAGLSNAPAFFQVLEGLAQGQPWDQGEFAKRLTLCSGPTVAGGLALVGLEALLRLSRTLHTRSLQYPKEPWMWNPAWAERRIRLSNRTAVITAVVILLVYGFVLVPGGMWMA